MFGSLAKAFGLGAPEAPVFQVPLDAPAFKQATGGDIAERAGLKVPKEKPELSQGSSARLLEHQLNTDRDMLGATKTLAHSLPPQKGVQWASDSARMVIGKLPPLQKEALLAADAFQANPTAATRAQAAAAAQRAGPGGPGGMAAMAASYCDVPDAPPIPGGAGLVPVCVTGAVVLAASISPPSVPKMPEFPTPKLERPALELPALPKMPAPAVIPPPSAPDSPAAIKNAQTFKPFLERGLALAAG
ncbi:MAG: hypothetical protein U1F61_10105 [Opitutaceae bacterium]